MNVHRVTEVKWNTIVTYTVILGKIISSKFNNYFKMKIMMEKVFIISQGRILPKNTHALDFEKQHSFQYISENNYFRERRLFCEKFVR